MTRSVLLRRIAVSARNWRPSLQTLAASRQTFASSSHLFTTENRVLAPILTPPAFHDYLRLVSANNTLLLLLFSTSGCAPCRTITPLLGDIVTRRSPTSSDKFSSISFAELELDSPDTSNGRMADLGVEYAVTSIPTLAGFGGRRAERVTERLTDTKMMADAKRMQGWIDEQMQKGDPFPSDGQSIFTKLFG